MITTRPDTDATMGFLSQEEEVSVDSLPVQGELPAWLGGTLVRVTPALLEHARHWFDGLAMLNAFGIGDGRVSYGSRFLESREYRHVREHGEMRGSGFGTDPCRSLFKRMSAMFDPEMTDNCNVNVTRLGERWVALTETPIAIEFDPETLATIGPVEWTPIAVTRAPTRDTTSTAVRRSATRCASARAAATSSTRCPTGPPSAARSRRCRCASRPTCTRSP